MTCRIPVVRLADRRDRVAGLDEPRREQVLHMLTTVTAWPSWEMMRSLDGLDVAEARAVVAELVRAVLDRSAGARG